MPTRARDGAGNLIFTSFCRQNDTRIEVTDARLIGELKSTYISTCVKGVDALTCKSDKLVISTPNADYLPQVNLGKQVISICDNGRWGAEDWSQWPQWHFDGQEHFAYILRKPKPSNLLAHPVTTLERILRLQRRQRLEGE
ncbi:hypothetical protein AGABI1DRAFT_134779 [Agaricus bisporus var. burnettii JB137-S8]|uniref:Uncharacterized protein n=1 Tax=Agaricus bisporus var. burnettii (strain JB137-S8 / ATCC MYA-4627 / FGSC 10392) TaxID=597362 RepID=K5WDV3_AGABU|nr:uncharacterized protein AGABI1DRAFT_134779 [Agaricus bisporus var. burnettii JB137-S8]EKM73436.1 hypothetical protein AGABI1DRAFT_134779 [Agaricus bisporus var. burnettii JB137-S8]